MRSPDAQPTDAYRETHRSHSRAPEVHLLPQPPPSVARVREMQRPGASRGWTALERIQAWGLFVVAHGAPLASGEEPAFQLAYNSADSGPVAEAGERSLAAGRVWLRLLNRPPFTLAPACVMTFEGHTWKVKAVVMTADGKRVVSGSQDTLRVWDLETGESRVPEGHRGYVIIMPLR